MRLACKTKTRYISILSILLICLLSGCVKSPRSGEEPGENDSVNTFDFATTAQYPLNLQLSLTEYPVLLKIYDQDPREKENILNPVYSAITDKTGALDETVSLPSYLKTVWLYTNYAGIPSPIAINVKKSGILFSYAASGSKAVAGTKVEPAAYTYPKEMMVLGSWNAAGLPDYLLSNRNTHPQGLLNDISCALPPVYPGDKQTSVFNTYLVQEHERNLHIAKKTKLTLVFAHEYATKQNAIGYYHYPTGNPPQSATDVKVIIALPNASYPNYTVSPEGEAVVSGGGQLSSGDQLELKYWDGTAFQDEFPANTTVGFVLSEAAFQDGNVRSGRKLYFSDSQLNTSESNPDCRQHCIAFESKKRNLVVYTFEDTDRSASRTDFYPGGNFRDNIFYIKPSEEAPFNTGNMLQLPEGTEPQPADNTITYSGTLSFEDLWPYMGDYDMNDLVIEYRCTHYRNAANRVIRTSDAFVFRHNGGQLASGFGYQLTGLTPNAIQSVRVTPGSSNSPFFKTNEKGLEYDNGATVIVFENSKKIKEGDVFQVETTFMNPVEDKNITPPYNPFIIINSDQGRGHELHLPNNAPTALMNKSLLGYGHDRSDASKGLYYVSESKYPFAIKIPAIPFDYPAELQKIDAKYSQFMEWVNSNGTTHQDWYLYPAK